MSDTSQNIALLRQRVEESANHRIKTSTDFTFLSGVIQERLGETLGTSTLKRIWGYVDGYASTREDTLNILSRFIGFPDWETFVSDYCEQEGVHSSHRVIHQTLWSKDMKEGNIVEVKWNPNRTCRFRYLGMGHFEVTESHNAKLKIGDTFHCERFTLMEPLYVDHLIQKGGGAAELFVMGNKGGLTLLTVQE
jgi:hypothetical protein